ncbi:unnamed protein product, partial [Phaeothamnion confervicola]
MVLKSSSKAISAVVAAALVAGTMTILSGSSGQVSASAPLNSGKGDRLDIRAVSPDCKQQAWPYYDAACLKDRRQPMSQAKAVRVISTDRT